MGLSRLKRVLVSTRIHPWLVACKKRRPDLIDFIRTPPHVEVFCLLYPVNRMSL